VPAASAAGRCIDLCRCSTLFDHSAHNKPSHIITNKTYDQILIKQILKSSTTTIEKARSSLVWYIQVVGDMEKARSSLVWYRGRTDVNEDIDEMEREKQAHLHEKAFTWRELCDKKLSRPLFIAIMMQVRVQLQKLLLKCIYLFYKQLILNC